MPHRTKKQKAKIAKVLAITSAVILTLTFIIKEILKDNLKDLHDSVARAESQFRTESGQSFISLQLLLEQEQAELAKLKDEATQKKRNEDYTVLIAQDTARAQEALGIVNSDLDNASRLIDVLPSGAKELGQLRDQIKDSVEKANKQIGGMLKPSPNHDVSRVVEVKIAMVMAMLQGILVAVLEDRALTAAHNVQEASEHLIRICSRAVYCLGFLLLAIGLFAATTGIKAESAE